MENLPPPTQQAPGWLPLGDLALEVAPDLLGPICDSIMAFLDELKTQNIVHGNLRPDNIMVGMENSHALKKPVRIKVVDYEWAGIYGEACYPLDREEEGYEGRPGDFIGPQDDIQMYKNWKASTESKILENI